MIEYTIPIKLNVGEAEIQSINTNNMNYDLNSIDYDLLYILFLTYKEELRKNLNISKLDTVTDIGVDNIVETVQIYKDKTFISIKLSKKYDDIIRTLEYGSPVKSDKTKMYPAKMSTITKTVNNMNKVGRQIIKQVMNIN